MIEHITRDSKTILDSQNQKQTNDKHSENILNNYLYCRLYNELSKKQKMIMR